MKATVLNFRRGRHNQKPDQLILELEDIETKGAAARYLGQNVVWESPRGKKIFGQITSTHGNRGAVRARFSKGLPGTVIGNKIKVIGQ